MDTSGNSSTKYLLYGRQSISDDDITAVIEVLRSDWLTAGPAVELFEHAIGLDMPKGFARSPRLPIGGSCLCRSIQTCEMQMLSVLRGLSKALRKSLTDPGLCER